MKKLLQQKAGETLVEVMVSMVLFLMILGVLHGAVLFAIRAIEKAQVIRADEARAEAVFRELEDIEEDTQRDLTFVGYDEERDNYGNFAFTVRVGYAGKNVTFSSIDDKQATKNAFFPLFITTRPLGGVSP